MPRKPNLGDALWPDESEEERKDEKKTSTSPLTLVEKLNLSFRMTTDKGKEYGGWIYYDKKRNVYDLESTSGGKTSISLINVQKIIELQANPDIVVLADFHCHPRSRIKGASLPSPADIEHARLILYRRLVFAHYIENFSDLITTGEKGRCLTFRALPTGFTAGEGNRAILWEVATGPGAPIV